jgi:hypothetical protein
MTAPEWRAFVHVVLGELEDEPRRQVGRSDCFRYSLVTWAAAAALLSKAPGLGWSDPEHPGHAVFPLLALLLFDEGRFPKTVASGTIKSRSRKCRLHVYS